MDNKNIKNKIIEAFYWRAAVKVYQKDKPVDTEVLDTIIESGRMSASAYGLQPYALVAVQDVELRSQILTVSYGQTQVLESPHLYVLAARTDIDEKFVKDYIKLTAEVRGMKVEDLKSYEDMMIEDICNREENSKSAWAGRQAYIALGSMLETAALLGVDAGPMEGFDNARVDEILDLKSNRLTSFALLCIGYRGDDKYSQMKKVRIPKSQFVIIK